MDLDRRDAARLLVRHHLGRSHPLADAAGFATVFDRLGSVQYDPLDRVGTNHDLVLQARLDGYARGAWQPFAYDRRGAFDGWDKQASLVRIEDWRLQSIHHRWRGDGWRERALDAYPDETDEVLAELRARGPLAVEDFEFQVRVPRWEGSWYGPRLTKHLVRALWHTGRIATHHRRHGRHVYDLVERVIPDRWRGPVPDEAEAVRGLVRKRHRTVGLLRPNASREVWSMDVAADVRRRAVRELVEAGELVPVVVDGERYHADPEALERLARPTRHGVGRSGEAIFVAPLDPLLWDREALQRVFGFEYVWEVYKPAAQRRWGYYTLPVVWDERFVARIEARRSEPSRGPTLQVDNWWWEDGAPTGDDGAAAADFLAALEAGVARFAAYLGVGRATVHATVPKDVAAAIRAGAAAAEHLAGVPAPAAATTPAQSPAPEGGRP